MNGVIRTMDDLGRIIIPKIIRQELGLKPGNVFEIGTKGGKLTIEKIAEFKDKISDSIDPNVSYKHKKCENEDNVYSYASVSFRIVIQDFSDMDIESIVNDVCNKIDKQYEVTDYNFSVTEAKFTYVYVNAEVIVEEEDDKDIIIDIINNSDTDKWYITDIDCDISIVDEDELIESPNITDLNPNGSILDDDDEVTDIGDIEIVDLNDIETGGMDDLDPKLFKNYNDDEELECKISEESTDNKLSTTTPSRIRYKGYIIKRRKDQYDPNEYVYDVIKPKWDPHEPVWDGCETIELAKEWIDSDIKDSKEFD